MRGCAWYAQPVGSSPALAPRARPRAPRFAGGSPVARSSHVTDSKRTQGARRAPRCTVPRAATASRRPVFPEPRLGHGRIEFMAFGCARATAPAADARMSRSARARSRAPSRDSPGGPAALAAARAAFLLALDFPRDPAVAVGGRFARRSSSGGIARPPQRSPASPPASPPAVLRSWPSHARCFASAVGLGAIARGPRVARADRSSSARSPRASGHQSKRLDGEHERGRDREVEALGEAVHLEVQQPVGRRAHLGRDPVRLAADDDGEARGERRERDAARARRGARPRARGRSPRSPSRPRAARRRTRRRS